MVLTFGWTGSPGQWQPWAEAIRVCQVNQAPDPQEEDGAEPFESFMIVDDGILVEPRMGNRPDQSAWCWESGLCKLLGPKFLNIAKLEEEEASYQAVHLGG